MDKSNISVDVNQSSVGDMFIWSVDNGNGMNCSGYCKTREEADRNVKAFLATIESLAR